MWFLGMIIGAAVGAMGGFGGAVLGGLIGIFVGVAIGRRPSIDDKWKRDVEDALKQLHHRLDALERGGVAAPAAVAETPAPPPPAEPAAEAAPVMSPRVAAAYAAVGNELPPGAVQPAPAAEPERPAAGGQPSAPPPKAEPDPFTRWLFGGNTLVRVGVIVLFFGVAFLLKYAAERDLVPIELRLA